MTDRHFRGMDALDFGCVAQALACPIMCDEVKNPEQAAVALGRVANALRSHELQRDDLDSLFGILT